jgi:hypothetical protein
VYDDAGTLWANSKVEVKGGRCVRCQSVGVRPCILELVPPNGAVYRLDGVRVIHCTRSAGAGGDAEVSDPMPGGEGLL